MSQFFHFGDSYATVGEFAMSKHFCGVMADSIGFQYRPYGMSGLSNEQILNKLIKLLFEFEKGDIIFINFSFFQRGCWYDSKDKILKSTNVFYSEIDMKKTSYTLSEKQKITSLLNYYIEHPEDYARKIFKLYNSILTILETKGIKIFYIYIEDTEWSDELLNVGTNIKFQNGFSKWLIVNDFHLGTDIHYTNGVQPMLADVILRKTNNLNDVLSKVTISINDIDRSKIIKSGKMI